VNYLENILKLKFDKNKIKISIETNNFKFLQQQEEEGKFKENMLDKNNKKIKFFDKGPNNDWKKNLDFKLKDEIESRFYNEMKELGYLI